MTGSPAGPFVTLHVSKINALADYLVRAARFEVVYRWPSGPDRAPEFVLLRHRSGARVGIGRPEHGPVLEDVGAELCWSVADVSAECERLVAAGGSLVQSPKDKPWGEVNAYVRAPGGLLLQVFSAS